VETTSDELPYVCESESHTQAKQEDPDESIDGDEMHRYGECLRYSVGGWGRTRGSVTTDIVPETLDQHDLHTHTHTVPHAYNY